MTRFTIVIIAIWVFLTGTALAAEPLQDKPTNQPSWTGIYVGGHLGYGWDRATWNSISANPSSAIDYTPGTRITSHQVSGVFGGGHLGFNYQLGSLVFGFEPAYSAGDFDDGSRSNIPPGDDEYTTKINHLFSTALRAGYATDRWLTYVKVGYASGRVKTRFVDAVGAEQGSVRSSERHHGFVMGPGIEFRLTPNVILGTEYSYFSLGSEKHSWGNNLGGFPGPYINKVDLKGIHQISARLSYLFSW